MDFLEYLIKGGKPVQAQFKRTRPNSPPSHMLKPKVPKRNEEVKGLKVQIDSVDHMPNLDISKENETVQKCFRKTFFCDKCKMKFCIKKERN